MKYRKLRIAVTALSLTACVLLVALWVRSYSWWDLAKVGFITVSEPLVSSGQGFEWDSADGVVSFYKGLVFGNEEDFQWTIDSERRPIGTPRDYITNESWYFKHEGHLIYVAVPHWFLVALIAISGFCPWIHWSRRFSLRTLLIATTLVAATLGAVIYAAK